MRIAIFGTGGVGGLFGGFLAKAGRSVDFIARGEQYQALKEHGLKVKTPYGDFHLPRVSVFRNPKELMQAHGPAELLLVCVKTWQLEQSISELKQCVGPNTWIVPLENGLVSSQLLLQTFPGQVLPGLCYGYYYVEKPGEILHLGHLAKLVFGETDHSKSDPAKSDVAKSDRARKILEVLTIPHLEVGLSEKIEVDQWAKFILIASTGSLTALCRVPVSEMMSFPGLKRLLEKAMREVEALARAKGIDVPEDTVPKAIHVLEKSSPLATTSMQRDFENKRRTELESMSGYVVREAAALQVPVPVPVHQWCYECLLPQELRARRETPGT